MYVISFDNYYQLLILDVFKNLFRWYVQSMFALVVLNTVIISTCRSLVNAGKATWWQRWDRSRNGKHSSRTSNTLRHQEPRELAKMEEAIWALPPSIRTRRWKRNQTSINIAVLHGGGSWRYPHVHWHLLCKPKEVRWSREKAGWLLQSSNKHHIRESAIQSQEPTAGWDRRAVHNSSLPADCYLWTWHLKRRDAPRPHCRGYHRPETFREPTNGCGPHPREGEEVSPSEGSRQGAKSPAPGRWIKEQSHCRRRSQGQQRRGWWSSKGTSSQPQASQER